MTTTLDRAHLNHLLAAERRRTVDRIVAALQEQVDDPINRQQFGDAVVVYRNAIGIARMVGGRHD